MRPDRMWNDDNWTNDRLRVRTDADCNDGPSLGCSYARGDIVFAIVAGNACLDICVLLASACRLLIRPCLETRTKESDMCASQQASKPVKRKEAD